MRLHLVALFGLLGAAACGGSGPAAPAGPAATPASNAQTTGTQLVETSFKINVPANATALARRPQYLGAGAVSVTITINTVNGSAPPGGLTTSVTSSLTPAACPCTVSGPNVPPGSDNFSFTTYDGSNGTGNVIASFTGTYTITAGLANTGNSVTLQGVAKTLTLSGIPSATAGTPFGSPQTLTVVAKDPDGNTIGGAYANALTITDSDSTGAQGSQLTVNSGTASSSVTVAQSSDVLQLNYGGRAISSATLTASASGATSGTASFAPALAAIVYSGPLSGTTPEIDLYAPSGTGSSGTFSASEVGLTNSPYNASLGAAAGGCGSIGTISPASGTSFTFAVAGSPSSGTCTITLSDGLGQTTNVTGTYTTSGFGVH